MPQPPESSQYPATEGKSQNNHGVQMRKLLRSKVTKAFLTKDGGWTEDICQAIQLAEFSKARAATWNVTPEELEIYYSFDENCPTQWDFPLPL